MKKRSLINALISLTGLLFICTAVFIGCKKNDSGISNAAPPNLVTKIKSSVSGFVTDENNSSVKNASVQFGTTTILTDKYGYFEATNIDVIKDAATVTVTMPGYFKGIKTYSAEVGKAAFFRIKLIPKTIAGTVNGSSGGIVTLSNGLIVILPANGVINTTNNTAYTGIVNVAAYWINPVSTDLPQIMPGDLRGINTDGNAQLLTTYGMAAVELTGSGGELLQIAAGKKATLSTPIPSSILSSAPATIPLWYFDETVGLWKQEGSATKNGSNYVGDVSHFSFWNWDMPNNFVQFSCTVLSANGQPIQNATVKISTVNNPFSYAFGYTNAAGYVSGLVPNNAQLLLEISNTTVCSGSAYSKTFTTTTTPVALGNIMISSTSIATVSGSITNCNNNPVTNGYVIVLEPNRYTRYNVDNKGAFNFSTILCGNAAPLTLIGEDAVTLQQSNSINVTINTGANNIGNLTACGISAAEFFYYTEDGISHLLTMPQDTVNLGGTLNTPEGWIWAFERTAPNSLVTVNFDNHNPTLNSYQFISDYYSPTIVRARPLSTGGATHLHITEFGPLGQFLAGTFSGIFYETANPNIQHNISVTFRARRK